MFFFFNDTATTEIYTLSLHDALPISPDFQKYSPARCGRTSCQEVSAHKRSSYSIRCRGPGSNWVAQPRNEPGPRHRDPKSTRLNSSHANISYAVFCLKYSSHSISIHR